MVFFPLGFVIFYPKIACFLRGSSGNECVKKDRVGAAAGLVGLLRLELPALKMTELS